MTQKAPVKTARRGAIIMAVIGIGIGAVFGLTTATGIAASGLGSVNLPPLNQKSAAPTPTPSPTPTTSAASTAAPAQPKAEISTPTTTVNPDDRISLTGRIPTVASGTRLEVQYKDTGGTWTNFGVDLTAKLGGAFSTYVITSRTGITRNFRVIDPVSGDATPGVAINIT